MKFRLLFSLVSVLLFSTACVTGTRQVDLIVDDYQNDKTSNGEIYIASIEDNRVFAVKPRDPSTPSVKGDLSSTSKEKLSTLIGRQRNGYGGAMGDVALPAGRDVRGEVKKLLKKGLESRGYVVTENENAPIKLQVDIDKFWAWFTPGVLAVSFESKLECDINFETANGNQLITVMGYGVNKAQIASNANWALAYKRGFADFLTNLDAKLDEKDL